LYFGCPLSVSTIAVKGFEMNDEDDETNPCKIITAKLSKPMQIRVSL
jgi:hypothetical protein